jgi:hypothetical protein
MRNKTIPNMAKSKGRYTEIEISKSVKKSVVSSKQIKTCNSVNVKTGDICKVSTQ